MDRHRDNRSMRNAHLATKALACTAFAALVLAPSVAFTISGDDQFLLTTSVAPNVVFLFDNSDSMNQIEWHPEFDPTAAPTCTPFVNETQYVAADLSAAEGFPNTPSFPMTRCGNTRTIFNPAQIDAKTTEALWLGRYLNWYLSDEADAYANEIETRTADPLGCTNSPTFGDVYRRTRGQAAKQTMLTVICIGEDLDVRFGLAEFRKRDDAASPPVDSNGGFITSELERANPSHAAELESAIKNAFIGSSTPLAETLFQLYTYYMSRDTADIPKGIDGLTSFPRYQYKEVDGSYTTNSSQFTDDPIQFECQKNYLVIVTDGVPSHDNFDQDPTDTAQGFADFVNLIGDYHVDGETEVPADPDEGTWYLDDIAKYMQDNDFRPDFAGDQVIDIYTVGLATDATTDAFLQKTADVANGLFFHAADGEELALALIAALNDIIEKSRSFTAATVPSTRTAQGGAFYNSFFLPSNLSAFWEGHLRAWTIDAAGDIFDSQPSCALIDPDPGECNSGPFKPICPGAPAPDCAVPFWDAGEEIPAPASRTLYTSKVISGTPIRVGFDDTLQAVDLDIQPFTAPPDPAPNSALYPVHGSTALNEQGLADEVVAYARGCSFNTGVTSADVGVPLACIERPWLLGDIFHSNPIVITRPRQPILEPSYSGPSGFQQVYGARTRVIYAGTNAGFLEAFHAGTYDTSNKTYDAGTGAELFGFMPWQSRKKIKNQPIDFATARTHYVDGPIQAADVWIHPTPTTSVKAANEWHTYLLGGLRGGGSQYYALDVTDPDDIDASLPYPDYLWEFPAENDASSDASYMGETWGAPIITRVRLEVVNDKGPDGIGYERWVAIVTGGYDPTSDPNPIAVTGSGATYDDVATAGQAIFMLDLKTGEVLAEKKFNGAPQDCPVADDPDPENQMCFAVVGTPAVLDLNFDGFADVIYFGDMGGQIFKWVINAIGEDRVNDGSGLRTQPAWPFRRFFKAPVESIAGKKYYKNFFFPPTATYVGGKLWLAFGSGERLHIAYPGDGTADDPDVRDENNRFYVMTDIDPFELGGLAELSESDLTDVSANQGAATFSTRGYYFKAADGEKFVTNVVIFAGDVIVASFTPATGGNVCTARGDATLYRFNVSNGEGQFEDASFNPLRSVSIGVGLPTDPRVSVGVDGKDTRIIIEKSGGELDSLEGKDIYFGGKLLSWREVD